MSNPHFDVPPHQAAKKPIAPMLIVAIVAVVACPCLAIVGAILFPLFSQARDGAIKTQTIKNMSKIGVAMHLYAAQYDDRFPLAANWESSIEAQISDREVLKPVKRNGPISYAFNAQLSGVSILSIPSLRDTPLIFESTLPGPSASGGIEGLYQADPYSLVIGFADGSARRVSADKVRDLPWSPKE